MRKTIQFLQLAFLLLLATACAETSPFKYESVPNDPLKARIYTLDNGLKVYMTVNKETPRIQTYIAVRVGGKNDPAETTGLAHSAVRHAELRTGKTDARSDRTAF